MDSSFLKHLDRIRQIRTEFGTSPPSQDLVEELCRTWRWAEDPAELEQLALCGLNGALTGDFSPRWLAHLLGLPHATAHVGLFTPNGMVVLQLRSSAKAQFPNAWDMAVTGHLSLPAEAPRSLISVVDAAERELEEELGLDTSGLDECLVGGRLEPVGRPRASSEEGQTGGRPWRDVEVRQLFAGTLTPEGLARITYQEAELSGVLLCRPMDALTLLSGPNAAAGALDSLRDLLSWCAGGVSRTGA